MSSKSQSQLIQDGTQKINSANQMYKRGRYDVAYNLYTEGIESLKEGLRNEPNDRIREALRSKIQTYMARREDVKGLLDKKQRQQQGSKTLTYRPPPPPKRQQAKPKQKKGLTRKFGLFGASKVLQEDEDAIDISDVTNLSTGKNDQLQSQSQSQHQPPPPSGGYGGGASGGSTGQAIDPAESKQATQAVQATPGMQAMQAMQARQGETKGKGGGSGGGGAVFNLCLQYPKFNKIWEKTLYDSNNWQENYENVWSFVWKKTNLERFYLLINNNIIDSPQSLQNELLKIDNVYALSQVNIFVTIKVEYCIYLFCLFICLFVLYDCVLFIDLKLDCESF